MDFFEYANMARMFANTIWVQFLVGGLCFAIVFVFQAVALFTIASREIGRASCRERVSDNG